MSLVFDILGCTSCPALVDNRTHVVPARVGRHYVEGGICVMGDAPDHAADRKGEPMVGREGQLLDSILQEAGLSREHVMLMYTVRCRPPNNRLDRHPEATLACDRWTKAELDAYKPGVVILTGNTPMRRVYGKEAKITAVRGKPRATSDEFEYGQRVWLPTFSTKHALQNPTVTATILEDFKLGVGLCDTSSTQ